MRIGQIAIDVAPLRESRDFRWLYSGQLASVAGNMLAATAANWQVYDLTHSPLAVGLVTLADSTCWPAACWPTTGTGGNYFPRSGCRRPCWPPG